MLRLRQIALVAARIEPVVASLRAELCLGEAFADPGVGVFGLENAVLPIGDTFLEVVSPTKAGTAAGRHLARSGDGGYMAIFQTDDLAAARARVASSGVRIVWEVELPDISTIHLHPRDLGGAIVSIDCAIPTESWRWAGPGWAERSRTDAVRRIVGATIAANEPAAMASRWAAVLGREARSDGDASVIRVDGGAVRFVPARAGRAEGLVAVDLEGVAQDRDAVEIGGVEFRYV